MAETDETDTPIDIFDLDGVFYSDLDERAIDSRDLTKLREEAQSVLDDDDHEITQEQRTEASRIVKIVEDIELEVGSNEWPHGIAFIPENRFKDYAQELAEDIGAVTDQDTWPATCIDWEKAADALKQDYSEAEIGAQTYLFRS